MKHLILSLAGAALVFAQTEVQAAVKGWLSWRGPDQNGTSKETGLPDNVDPKSPLWMADFPGQSTPVIADGRLYIMGYLGEGADLQEGIACFDAESGQKIWEKRYNDFLSDTIYLRYATSSPTVDAETGNVYMLGTQGMLGAFSRDGKPLWSHSMMEKWGRLTFPNSRTATPVIDGDLMIIHGIAGNWGTQGAAADRFYAYDKKTGELVWAGGTGERPKDNSFSHPFLGWYKGRRALFAATGDGGVVCMNARTGETIWRVPISKAGINASVLVHNNDKVVAIYGTPYEPGQMVAFKIPDVTPGPGPLGFVTVERLQVELWSNDLSTSTSSPILVGDTIYVVAEKGDLCAVDAKTGKISWRVKLGVEQRNACPMYADGKLYVPILDDPEGKTAGGEAGSAGGFYIIKPGESEGKILTHVGLNGRCFGSPTAYNGKIYVQTAKSLYCFGKKGNNAGLPKEVAAEKWPVPGAATQLQVVPSEVLLHPGQTATFRVRKLDANGFTVEEVSDLKTIQWATFIPPTARVRAGIKGAFTPEGILKINDEPVLSAGQFEATLGNLKGYMRGRVLQQLPIKQDFDAMPLSELTTNAFEPPTPFSYPPLPWIGARFRFEVRETNGVKSLTKTIDNKFFQRGTVFIGTPDMKNYTIQADVMSEGNKRKMSEVGIINQRYLIVMKGNEQKLEVNSNLERLRVPATEAPSNFKWSPNSWYRLKARVDVSPDGTGVVRAKAWPRDQAEPDAWSIEVPHKTAHQNGSPGLYGFSPQDMRVYVDNVTVTAN